ncbi:MAG: holo-ACP synthase [Eggerthellaceae bacterium]|jgi:holo-[acyl-carrier protein] synthase
MPEDFKKSGSLVTGDEKPMATQTALDEPQAALLLKDAHEALYGSASQEIQDDSESDTVSDNEAQAEQALESLREEAESSYTTMQVNMGVDIVEIERFRELLNRSPWFPEKAFSEDERSYCEKRANPVSHYACRFAAKEAVVKALGCGFSDGVWVRDVEVRTNAKGRPFVVLSGRAKEIAQDLQVREIPLSLSFTHQEAIACALVITDDAVDAQEARHDPKEELAQRFKELRDSI